MAGEFDGADYSTRASLTIGLRSIAHPVCRRAIERLRDLGAVILSSQVKRAAYRLNVTLPPHSL